MTKLRRPNPIALHARNALAPVFIVPRARDGMFDVSEPGKPVRIVDAAERDALIDAAIKAGNVGIHFLDRTKRGAQSSNYPMKGYHFDAVAREFVLDGFHGEKCTGEAHDPEVGGMIDNCGCCAPRWGWVVRADV